ncbi:MAG TPA: response regulator [Nitrososphaeraceae archaeon]|nr:response regulator [Nitrososphaeraceae archaeon]
MRILIAEDDLDISTLYKRALENRNHTIDLTPSGETCLRDYLDTLHNTATIPSSSRIPTPDISPMHNGISRTATAFSVTSPYDVVILDYKMPGINGMDVAKEILAVNPNQRIIFASAYVKETLEESVKQLKQIVELMQKPFSLSQLVDTVEDKEAYEELKKLNVDIDLIKASEPTHALVIKLLDKLRRIQKSGAF